MHAPLLPAKTERLKPWDNITVDKSGGGNETGRKQRGGVLRASHSDHLLAFHNPLRLSLSAATAGGFPSDGSENGEYRRDENNEEIDPRLLNGTLFSKQQTQQSFSGGPAAGTAPHPMTRMGSVPVFSGIHHVKVAEHTHKKSEVESSAKGELIAGRARRRELDNFVRYVL